MNNTIQISVPGATIEQIAKYHEIFSILLEKGCLDGVKGGSVELHFDNQGIFQGPEFHYWPWRRRRS